MPLSAKSPTGSTLIHFLVINDNDSDQQIVLEHWYGDL